MAKNMARFPSGTSIRSTRNLTQEDPVRTERGSGKGKTGGMPGYIKTKQDTSSGGLASTKPVGPRFNEGETTATTNKTTQMRDQGAYIGRRGSSNTGFDANKFRGSSDQSYRATSLTGPGKIRRLGEPKAPASRAPSEKEGRQTGRSGLRNSVARGGVTDGGMRLTAGGHHFADA